MFYVGAIAEGEHEAHTLEVPVAMSIYSDVLRFEGRLT